jgi:hypothetical protein
MTSAWKGEFDRTMERIWQQIAEIQRIREGKPPEPHLRLVPPPPDDQHGRSNG